MQHDELGENLGPVQKVDVNVGDDFMQENNVLHWAIRDRVLKCTLHRLIAIFPTLTVG